MNEHGPRPSRRDVLKSFLGAVAMAAVPKPETAEAASRQEFVGLHPDVIAKAADMVRRHRIEAMPPEWQALVERLRNQPHNQKILGAFQAFHSDIQYSKTDTYLTPAELLKTHAGDCKDMAFARYFLLKELGVKSDVILTLIKENKALHAYTQAVTTDGSLLVLDHIRHLSPISRAQADAEYHDLLILSREVDVAEQAASTRRTESVQ